MLCWLADMIESKNGWRTEIIRIKEESFSIEHCEDTSVLTLEQRTKMASELTPLTGEGFLRFDLNSDELTEDVANHVITAPRLIVARNNEGKAVAFIASATSTIEDILFYHLGGIIVDPSLQGSGLGLKMLQDELKTTRAKAIVLRTQSMKMLRLTAKVAQLDDDLTRAVAPIVYPTNLDGIVNRGVYRQGRSLYENEEQFAPTAIEWIDWRNGDSLVVAGFVGPDIAKSNN